MKSFVFSLQPILNVKISIEKEKQRELGRLKQSLEKLEREKENLNLLKERLQGDILHHYKEKEIDYNYINLINNYIENHINRKIIEISSEMTILNEKIARATEELINAMKERKILENLKEKRYEAYFKEYKRKVYNTIDELAVQRTNIV